MKRRSAREHVWVPVHEPSAYLREWVLVGVTLLAVTILLGTIL